MEVSDILREAAADVETASIPDDLRVAAFQKALELRSQGYAATGAQGPVLGSGERARSALSAPLAAAAAKLRVPAETIAEVVEVSEDRVDVIVAPSRLPRQKAAATRLVALIVVSVRQASGIDDSWTSSEIVREQCRMIGIFDSANFAGDVASMSDVFGFKGTGRGRQLRVNLRGFEEAGRRIVELSSQA